MGTLRRTVTAGVAAAALALPWSATAEWDAIPGLRLKDVTSRLESAGFACGGGQRLEDAVLGWTCERDTAAADVSVVILGAPGGAITRVDAGMIVLDGGAVDPPARAFLASLATLRYTGAQPVRARAWVRRYTGTRRHRAFGGANYRLQTTRLARFLVITGRPG